MPVVPSKSRTSLLAIVLVAIVTIGGVGSYLAFHQQPEIQITTTTSAVTTIPCAQIQISKPKAFSHPVIASTCKVRGNLIVKGEIASVPSQ